MSNETEHERLARLQTYAERLHITFTVTESGYTVLEHPPVQPNSMDVTTLDELEAVLLLVDGYRNRTVMGPPFVEDHEFERMLRYEEEEDRTG